MTEAEIAEMNSLKWWHRIEVEPGIFTPGECFHGPDGGDWPTKRFGLPEDLTDKLVFDVGAFNGLFSFECEKRGAVVHAIDPFQDARFDRRAFDFAARKLNSGVSLSVKQLADVYNPGYYDLILFFGVFYHLENPFRALEQAADLTAPGGQCIVETAIPTQHMLAHNPFDEILVRRKGYLGDTTNEYYPTVPMLRRLMECSGFSRTEVVYQEEGRATVRGFK